VAAFLGNQYWQGRKTFYLLDKIFRAKSPKKDYTSSINLLVSIDSIIFISIHP
jgi:hypothetical protein